MQSSAPIERVKTPLNFKSAIHAKPIHTESIPSALSKEAEEQNYRGFLNLAILFLGANLVRLIIENFQKYGSLISIPGRNIPFSDLVYVAIMVLALGIHVSIVFVIEKLAPVHPTGWFVNVLAVLNIAILLLVTPWIIWAHMYHPCVSGLVLFFDLVFSMKMISFHAVNGELRSLLEARKKTDDPSFADPYPSSPYPESLSVSNFLYFLAAPTLCYQPEYPRIARFRRSFFFKRMFEFVSAMVMAYIAIEQFASPTVKNSMKHIEELNLVGIVERILKLSPTSLYIWLLGFYGIFHSFFNAVAELLRFGDRQFYQEWWNANTLDEYWRLWNAPVHIWLKRHIYVPLRAKGFSPVQAQLVIFAISAFFHEYLVSIPTHSIQGWAFLAMLLQVPLIYLTKKYMEWSPNSSTGNFFFWITLCVFGQPMCVLLYYRAWIRTQSINS